MVNVTDWLNMRKGESKYEEKRREKKTIGIYDTRNCAIQASAFAYLRVVVHWNEKTSTRLSWGRKKKRDEAEEEDDEKKKLKQKMERKSPATATKYMLVLRFI